MFAVPEKIKRFVSFTLTAIHMRVSLKLSSAACYVPFTDETQYYFQRRFLETHGPRAESPQPTSYPVIVLPST